MFLMTLMNQGGCSAIVTILYFSTFLASLFLLFSLLLRNKRIDTMFAFFAISVCANSMGRYLICVSNDLEMAIWANRILYAGAIFCPLSLLFILAGLCGVRIPRPLKYVLVLGSLGVFLCTLTIGHSPLYYEDVQLGFGNGYAYLIKTYGPAHVVYPALMILFAATLLFCIRYASKKKSSLSFRTISIICVMAFLVVMLYIFEMLTHSSISYLSIGYLVSLILMQELCDRINMYDMSVNIASYVDRLGEYGYIVLDRKYRYISANEYIKELFSEIREDWRVDEPIPNTESYLYQKIVLWAIECENNGTKTIQVDGRFLTVSVKELTYRQNRKVGCLIEFIDRTEEHNYVAAIEKYNTTLHDEVARKTSDVLRIQEQLIIGMGNMVESRDNNTGGHVKRTSTVVEIFSEYLLKEQDTFHLPEEFLKMVAKAAPMHDLGKITVDDRILRKKGKYTEEEYAQMKKHAEEGAKIVEKMLRGVEDDAFVEIAVNVACYHHEKWNGLGYPKGLSGTDIPVEARIMALADVFDALVSKRCYKEAFSYDEAFSIIKEFMGVHFDPDLAKAFLQCRPQLEELYNSVSD